MREQIEKVLRTIGCFLLDMDGTIYLGDQLIDGTHEFLQAAKEKGYKVLFLTNNSSKNGAAYLKKLAKMGIEANAEDVLTSGQAAAETILQCYPGKKVWVMGNTLLKEEMEQWGVPLTEKDPDLVLTAFDTELTYQKLWDCCNYVRAGLPYLATHPDFNCPTETGFMPDLGAMTELIYASTGRRPDRVIGKPERDIFACASRRTGVPMENTAICGDRLYTDIAAGQKQGLASILVLTGETKWEDLANSDVNPDLVLERLADLVPYL